MTRDSARVHLAHVVSRIIQYLERKGQALPADLLAFHGEAADSFARVRGAGPGRRAKEIVAVNAYQRKLESAYSSWADDLADDLAEAEDDDAREEVMSAAMAALLVLLRRMGRENLPEAIPLGLDGTTPFPGVYGVLEDEILENDEFLETGLIPDITRKIRDGLSDADIVAALAVGAGAAALRGILGTMEGRVSLYAGSFWDVVNHVRGMAAGETGSALFWQLEERARHCADCLQFGDQTYDSWDALIAETGGVWPAHLTECGNNCRCVLEPVEASEGEETS